MTPLHRRHGVQAIVGQRVDGRSIVEDACWVAEERPLTIDVEGVGAYTLMWTPTSETELPCGFTPADGVLTGDEVPEALALAAGFAFTEGLLASVDDIRGLSICQHDSEVVRLTLVDPERAHVRRRNVVIGSSCGICGGRERIDDVTRGIRPVDDSLRLDATRLEAIMATLRRRQAVWLATGGTHAAAIFDGGGRILTLFEDLGRHNALDKAIGHCLLARVPLAGCGAALTSRVTLEMASKAARAGLELVAAVSAASTLAIEVADRFGVTLCGFVRNGRATAFSHGHRLQAESASACGA
ncbi:MAG: formate dehydrogenase accessory sulfurtransferase FdhD [Nitrospira sp.]|nr:formate dehydrogenase accessory sulfurtransferase FdhD [Nitrospira sp.]